MKIKSEFIVSFSAIFVSVSTLFVYIYQARIMQKQQHTSVLPYVEWLYNNAGNEFWISVENKGIGPAFVKGVTMKLDGEEVESNSALFKKLLGPIRFNFSNSTVDGRVISPGEKIEMVHVYDTVQGRAIDSLLLWDNSPHKFSLEICYCSVYGDCWTTDGNNSREGKCSK